MKDLLAKNIKYLRLKSGKTQTDIGLQLKKAHTSIGNWEKGIAEPSLSEIEQIARIFEMDASDLLFKDLENVHLMVKEESEPYGKKVHPNVHGNVHLIAKKGTDLPERHQAETPPLWAIGMLQKLEAMAADIEALKKDNTSLKAVWVRLSGVLGGIVTPLEGTIWPVLC